MRGFVAAALVLVAQPALAQTFEDVADGAVAIDRQRLAGLLWSLSADCARAGDDSLRRQCEAVKAARGELGQGTFSITGEAAAFAAGAWDEDKRALPIFVRACLACQAPVELGGDNRFVVGRGSVTVDAGVVRAPELARALRRFPDRAAADKWLAQTGPRLRTQIVFRLPRASKEPKGPGKLEAWSQGGVSGWFVEVLGFRVFDPCDGSLVVSNPQAAAGEVDASVCEGVRSGRPIDPEARRPKAEPAFQLTADEVRRGMQSVTSRVNTCLDAYGMTGTADVYLEVKSDGTVSSVEVRGQFAETPTGKCVVEAVKKARFPRFTRESMQIHYPFILR